MNHFEADLDAEMRKPWTDSSFNQGRMDPRRSTINWWPVVTVLTLGFSGVCILAAVASCTGWFQ
jgi:hypothetical protein